MGISNKIIKLNKLNEYQITAIISAVICVLTFLAMVFIPTKLVTDSVSVRVEKGWGLSKISENLGANGLVRNRFVFMVLAKGLGHDHDLRAGRYTFSGWVSMADVLYKLSAGLAEPEDISVFIPEGYNVWQIDKRLADLGFIAEGDFAKDNIDNEGYLFPDTYKVDSENAIFLDSSEALTNKKVIDTIIRGTIVKKIGDTIKANYDKQTEQILNGLSFSEKRRAIIIASILEKEVRTAEDMKIVSGIINKRIKKGMALQLDATVSYGACLKEFKKTGKNCVVSNVGVAKEIKIDSEYNTYTRTGLPPGPISNPGLKAIEAALNPADSPYLYYLNAKDGRTIFSKTGAEHTANRLKYLGL